MIAAVSETEEQRKLPMESKRVVGLDILRCLAVILVLFFHFSNDSHGRVLAPFRSFGWMGVDLFFVLSGYLIGSQLFKSFSSTRGISFARFFQKRLFRTLPSYFVVLGIYFLFDSLRERPALPPLWKFLTFTQNFGLDRKETGAFSHAWSLCVEEQFYLLLPSVAFGVSRMKFKRMTIVAMIFIALIGGIVLRAALWMSVVAPLQSSAQNFGSWHDQWLYYPSYVRLDGLLFGIGLALTKIYFSDSWRALLNHKVLALVTSVTLITLARILTDYRYTSFGAAFLYPLVAFGFAALLIAAVGFDPMLSRMKLPGVQLLASLSYGIYLLQKLVFHFSEMRLREFGVEPFSWIGFLATMFFCITASGLLYVLVERPFLFLRDRSF